MRADTMIWSGTAWWSAMRDADLGSVVVIVVLTLSYLLGVRRVWHAAGRGRGISIAQAGAYAAGVLVLAFALVSPLDTAADAVFAAHMIQHVLLITVVPAALVLGRPGVAWLWTLPRWGRRRITAAAGGGVRSIWRGVTAPWIVWMPHTVALWVWHLPRLYVAALQRPLVHAVEHASFLGTALLVWEAALRPRGARRGGALGGILVLLIVSVQSAALGALLTFARRPWYPVHGAGPGVWGLTPLQDQQVAGLVMWIPGGVPYLIGIAMLFLRWLNGASAPSHPPRWGGAPAVEVVA